MKLEGFLQLRAEIKATRPELLDLSELNLYRTLAPRFPAIEPSTHAQAPYRCHLAERYLAHLGLSRDLKPNTLVSHGVRRSLKALFTLLAARGQTVGVPDDVYPVYGQLAAEAGALVVPWSARHGLPGDDVLNTLDALLICDPLKPWGTTIGESDAARLSRWTKQDERRMLLVDSAYATPPSALALQLVHEQSAALLVSLAKGWLIPDHAGLCIVPSRFQRAGREAFAALPKDEIRLRIGYAALTEHADRVLGVQQSLAELATRLDALTARRPELAASKCVGYFATSTRSFADLLAQGVLAVPASVFGAPGGTAGCVLSSLHPSHHGPRQ